MGMALLLDPRTKRSAKNFLRVPDRPEAFADKILKDTHQLLLLEHREIYRLKYSKSAPSEDSSDASISPSYEALDASEGEMSLLCGEEVSRQTEQSFADLTLVQEADAVLEKWLALRVEWAEVAKHQYTDVDERSAVLGKLSIPRANGKRVWNVERLCQYIDVRQWFVETGECAFPTISMLSRVWLGRNSSTAFQERVLSTGSFVMGPLQT